jgi:hypothetical protein
MQSTRRFAAFLLLATLSGNAFAQGLETQFQATRGQAAGPSGEAFRRTPDAPALLFAKLRSSPDDCLLAIDHLQRMPRESAPAAADLLQLAAVADACGVMAAVAIGNVAPWWPAERRADARQVLSRLFPQVARVQDRVALSRSYTRATLEVTGDLAAIEAMLASDDAFQVEFGLHVLEQLESEARPLLPLLRTMATTGKWPVRADVKGTMRELPCVSDWTSPIRDRLYWALRRIDPADPSLLPFYLERWAKAPTWVQLDYVQQFGRMGRDAAPALPQVVALSRSHDALLAREAVTVLGMIGVPGPAAVARLRELQGADDRQLAMRASAALRQLQGNAAPRDRADQ